MVLSSTQSPGLRCLHHLLLPLPFLPYLVSCPYRPALLSTLVHAVAGACSRHPHSSLHLPSHCTKVGSEQLWPCPLCANPAALPAAPATFPLWPHTAVSPGSHPGTRLWEGSSPLASPCLHVWISLCLARTFPFLIC